MLKQRRAYTFKSYKLMSNVRKLILFISSPLWLPFHLLVLAAYKIEDVLDILDDVLQKILDKIIPQVK